MGCRQVVRHWFLVPAFAGSNPAIPAMLLMLAIMSTIQQNLLMTQNRSLELELSTFKLYNHFHTDKPFPSVQERIEAGILPDDAIFRLASIGRGQSDPNDPQTSLRWSMLIDMANITNVSDLNPVTHELLFGPEPDAVIDFWPNYNKQFYQDMDIMYYRLKHLVEAIREKREDEGRKIGPSHDYQFANGHIELEARRCKSLAKPLWRTIIKRTNPEWLENPQDYYHPLISFGNVYYVNDRTAQSRIVSASIISDSAVLSVYEEAVDTGVIGIGPQGKESLRRLLAEEHPELN